jgi:hypothetical protein
MIKPAYTIVDTVRPTLKTSIDVIFFPKKLFIRFDCFVIAINNF